ncbi:phosphatase SGT1a [Chlorella sorokiniana]|uniref:Phosphatase SGT1a n=1 Tax=Chlorella sorokiniana TaxID=3076 RepID=A0A2P6TRI0_CHLSO|nr:phosphatase SGT1a [Chlorella sorokiniana]|eukprot:PRW56670.1 phosphatase SGT1a [Chlorella sorokiniana]
MAEPGLLQQAQEAAKARQYERSLELFNQAVDADPSAEALAGRAAVHNKLKNHMEAAADAARATELAPGMAAAHREQGLAYYNLEEFESALDAFQAAADLEPDKMIHKSWLNMCRVQLGEEPEAAPVRQAEPPAAPLEEKPSTSGASASSSGGKGGGITLQGDELKAFLARAQASGGLQAALGGAGGAGRPGVLPPQFEEVAEEEEGTAQPKNATVDDPEFSKYWKAPIAAAVAAAIPDKPVGSKYRHQWFQSPERVEVDVLAKGMKKEAVGVTIEERRLKVVTIGADGQQDYCLDVQLHAPVVPEESRFQVLGTKIEVKMKKAVAGMQWPGLEAGSAAAASPASPAPAAPAAPAAAAEPAAGEAGAAPAPAGPPLAYPYAGKKIDWDKFAEEVKKEEKDEKLDGDAGLLKFFKELYEGGDEDTRRAMVKSMQESGGTALSMNWSDVGKRDYSKKGKGEDDDDEEWNERTARSSRGRR